MSKLIVAAKRILMKDFCLYLLRTPDALRCYNNQMFSIKMFYWGEEGNN